jgi:Protein of unknown function (DUF2934)
MLHSKTNSSSTSTHLASPESPTHQTVQSRAYQLFERRGKIDGHADHDWYQAENDLRIKNRES